MNSDLDPTSQNAFVAAVHWLDGTVLGSLASVVAIIAVGCVGLLLISGRMEVRRAVQVIVGCFIIFGASTIANGMLSTISARGSSSDLAPAAPPPQPLAVPPTTAHTPSTPYNPYASAAYLPPR